VTEYDSIYVFSGINYCEAAPDLITTNISSLIQNECLKSIDKYFCSIDPNLIRDIVFMPNKTLDSNIFNIIPIRIEFDYKCINVNSKFIKNEFINKIFNNCT
jgi:hypothetical protein